MEAKANPNCRCTYNCPRHGKCTECRAYHSKIGTLTHCMISEIKK